MTNSFPGGTSSSSSISAAKVSKNVNPEVINDVLGFFDSLGFSDPTVRNLASKDFYSHVLCHNLESHTVERGRVSCSLLVKPVLTNYFNALHGGAVAAVAERVSIACARTVVSEEKELFLGELSMSYLSAAPMNTELMVDGTVVRSGRNITVVALEFKMKNSGKLVYIARATFYHSPISKL